MKMIGEVKKIEDGVRIELPIMNRMVEHWIELSEGRYQSQPLHSHYQMK